MNNVTGEFDERVKVATLQALGYMCDDVSSTAAVFLNNPHEYVPHTEQTRSSTSSVCPVWERRVGSVLCRCNPESMYW